MTRSKWNFIIDICMFICMILLASIGFLIKYTLSTGREAWQLFGKNVELSMLGLNRHVWGDIHLYIAFVLLGLFLLHILMHWKMIKALF